VELVVEQAVSALILLLTAAVVEGREYLLQ
jgi:hypothetical protein